MMREEDTLLKKRLLELARQCEYKNIPVFSHFLNLNEQTVFHGLRTELPPVQVILEGGYEAAERKIVCFLPVTDHVDGYLPSILPVTAVWVRPKAPKFSGDCSHRDYLGAVLNLGLDRNQIGDILLEGQEAWILCREQIAPFIIDQLTQVRRNAVVCQAVPLMQLQYTPRYKEVSGSIASLRLDSLVSLAFGLSRSKAAECVKEERVFVNGKLTVSSAYEPAEGALISVRKLGKFRYKGFVNKTKKGRDYVALEVFV